MATEVLALDGSSYFQTTVRIGNKDMHELTKRAVEMEFGDGFLGGAGLAVEWLLMLRVGLFS